MVETEDGGRGVGRGVDRGATGDGVGVLVVGGAASRRFVCELKLPVPVVFNHIVRPAGERRGDGLPLVSNLGVMLERDGGRWRVVWGEWSEDPGTGGIGGDSKRRNYVTWEATNGLRYPAALLIDILA